MICGWKVSSVVQTVKPVKENLLWAQQTKWCFFHQWCSPVFIFSSALMSLFSAVTSVYKFLS